MHNTALVAMSLWPQVLAVLLAGLLLCWMALIGAREIHHEATQST